MRRMTNEEAIEVLDDMKVKVEIPKAAVTQWERNTALDMAIEALKYSEVPNSSDCISRQAAIDAARKCAVKEVTPAYMLIDKAEVMTELMKLPSAQPDIKQAAKLLSDFIESCPGGDSYLIAPDGEELRTDWGYTIEGIQLIHDWAERRSDG